ncbi:MAG: class I SAM-dependent methyltransferase [Anaerolineales bacterium]|nr:class I SAM-dependent methyltransferase [Anaerolineales bacterium]MCX7755008.1 class I SAM-dependent methyltransferase [Anaerolineales bacterium]MDW8278793.1 class I SAM-dependent methyltransferase [Anaerolineales bacterium]
MADINLLTQFLQVYAFQPATAFWRAVEIEVLRHYLPETGQGLDLGCGDGKLTAILFGEKLSHFQLVGIDSDPGEVEEAGRTGIYQRLHVCDAAQIPEQSRSFDFIISNSVLEHIEAIEPVIQETARLLKPGGKFVFTVPGPNFHACLRGPFGLGTPRAAYLEQLDQRLAHVRYWSQEEWHTCLSKYGFQITGHEEYLSYYEVRRWEDISRMTAGILYSLTRRTQTPMQIQKRWGLRRTQHRIRLPPWVARILAGLLCLGLKHPQTELFGCLLIQAERTQE